MAISLRRRSIGRLVLCIIVGFIIRNIFTSDSSTNEEIRGHNVLERVVSRSDRVLDVQRHPFLQARLGRDDNDDLLTEVIKGGVEDFWERFQKPYITGHDTSHMDTQVVRTAIEELLALNGWVAALCPTLVRPFGQNKRDDNYYDSLIQKDHLYYVAIVIHSADHFLVDQLAVIVQLTKRLGTQNLFVSMLDYSSTDSTPTLLDLCEATLILLGVPFRIRRVSGMTEDPSAAYYPLEEAYMRNLALQPLRELYGKRKIKFHRVVWLKGFTCPNDILELIKVSDANEAAMVCGMDWAELNGNYIFSDRQVIVVWRARDLDGDQFRQSKSSSDPNATPLRNKESAARFTAHLPFQVFCCESGTHVVDPEQSYYRGISYRSGTHYHNISTPQSAPSWDPEAPCMDSSQAWFCRDLWIDAARNSNLKEETNHRGGMAWLDDNDDFDSSPIPAAHGKNAKRDEPEPEIPVDEPGQLKPQALPVEPDPDANAGSDYDAMPDSDVDLPDVPPPSRLSIPNSSFRPARILVNPRCVTTYAGVSHTKLALDLFGEEESVDASKVGGKYVLDDWESAPDSFVCQEQRQTGGRKATKTQRRLGFMIHDELERDS
ncbi:glycosyltransferase family 69 protein [Hysterangium stoloniferum]|nr:glycosyltransferase family 69 protein [Hysterangium stoloniferum]